MVDILPFVAGILKETGAQIEIAENDFTASFPLITLLEVGNSSDVITDGKEQFSGIVIQIDNYDMAPEKVTSLSGAISVLMLQNGFRRGSGQLMKEDGIWRYYCTYSCYVDSQNRIYSGENYI
jgi:hypothetical protein